MFLLALGLYGWVQTQRQRPKAQKALIRAALHQSEDEESTRPLMSPLGRDNFYLTLQVWVQTFRSVSSRTAPTLVPGARARMMRPGPYALRLPAFFAAPAECNRNRECSYVHSILAFTMFAPGSYKFTA